MPQPQALPTQSLKTMRTTVPSSMGNYDSSNDDDYTESSLGASSDNDDESTATTSTQGRRRKDKTKKDKATNKKGKEDESRKRKKMNNFLHCKELGQMSPHPHTSQDKCFWNKSYKGWRLRLICNELEVDFKPRSKFSAEMGGWPESDK